MGEAGVLDHRAARTPGPGPKDAEGDLKKLGAALANTDDQQIAGSLSKRPRGLGPCVTFGA